MQRGRAQVKGGVVVAVWMSRALLCVCAVKIVGGGLLTICMHYLPCNVLL